MSNSHMSIPLVACFDGESQPDEVQPVEVTNTQPDETQDAPPVEETPEPEPVVELITPEQLAEKLAERDREWESRFTARDAETKEIIRKYDQATMERSISDAAVAADAHNVEVLTAFLRPYAKVVDGQPVIEIENFRLSPSEAVGWMKSQVDRFGALFKSNVIPGIGSHNAIGGARPTRNTDVRGMDAATYRQAKKENPTAFGFGGVG